MGRPLSREAARTHNYTQLALLGNELATLASEASAIVSGESVVMWISDCGCSIVCGCLWSRRRVEDLGRWSAFV
jgi:hypothetical protein